MVSVLYVLQFIITIILIVLVIFQKSKGGAGLISSNPYNSFFANKAIISNPLTKITIIFGIALFVNSITIGALEIHSTKSGSDIINKIEQIKKTQPTNNKNQQNKVNKIPLEGK